MSKKSRKLTAVVAVIGLVGLSAMWLLRSPAPVVAPEKAEKTPSKVPELATKVIPDAGAKNTANSTRSTSTKSAAKAVKKSVRFSKRARVAPVTIEERTDLTADEKQLMRAIESAMDSEKFEDLQAQSAAVLASTNTEIRSDYVDALGWFGEKGMAELAPFMADPDAEIAQSARDNWTSSLSDIENEATRADLVESTMLIFHSKETLEALVLTLSDCDDKIAVQTVVDLIEGTNPDAAQVAREHYEFITGEEWTGVEAAERYLKESADDPEDEPEEAAPDQV